jgi:hypothetical protein
MTWIRHKFLLNASSGFHLSAGGWSHFAGRLAQQKGNPVNPNNRLFVLRSETPETRLCHLSGQHQPQTIPVYFHSDLDVFSQSQASKTSS